MKSGKSISALTELVDLNEDDIFMVSQHDIYVYDEFNSRKAECQTLVDAMLDGIVNRRKFGTTAICSDTEFSPIGHSHDDLYNELSIKFFEGYPEHRNPYPPNSRSNAVQSSSSQPNMPYSALSTTIKYPLHKDSGNSCISVGNIFCNGTLSALYVPLSAVYDYAQVPWYVAEPQLGAIRFCSPTYQYGQNYNPNIKEIYASDMFDGWLYPNGDTFDLSDFTLSNELQPLYGHTPDDGKFTIPCLSNFIKFTGELSDGMKWHQGNNVLCAHAHGVAIDNATGTASITGKVPYTTDTADGQTFHRGTGMINLGTKENEVWVSIDKLLNAKKASDLTNSKARSYWNKNLNTEIKRNAWRNKRTYYSAPIDISCWGFDVDFNDMDIQPTSFKPDDETYPDYYKLPIMIYVGRRNRGAYNG